MKKILLTLFILTQFSTLHAYQSVLDTGEILQEGRYRALLEPQLILSESGFNIAGRFDTSINGSSEFHALLGTGISGFHTGFYYKTIPFPDYGNQPAIGFKAGFEYGRIDNEGTTTLRVAPIASKQLQTDEFDMSAYLSLPVGFSKQGENTFFPLQLVVGSKFRLPDFESIDFATEVGLGLSHSPTYISIAVIFYIDDDNGLQFR